MRRPTPHRCCLRSAGVLLLLLAACRGPAADVQRTCAGVETPAIELPALDSPSPRISRHNLAAWVGLLASPRLGGRHAGDPGSRATAALLAERMADLGLAPPWPDAGFCQPFDYLEDVEHNVVAHLGIEPAAGAGRAIFVGAHYDGQGFHPAGGFYPGADDNASGVAALLEVARVAASRSAGVGWVFAALGGEEVGQAGARAYLAAPSVDLARVELAIHLDMVGRPLPGDVTGAIGYLAAGGSRAATAALLDRAGRQAGVDVVALDGFGDARPTISDAEVFGTRLPTVLLSTALHEDHHELTDTPDRVDLDQIERAAGLVLALADILSGR